MEHLVETILVKSQKLVKQKNLLLQENEQLKQTIDELKAVISSQESSINELLDKQKVQHIAGVFGKEEKKTSLRKIDEVVREIDKCMALLNN
jgi:CHASE3 domain sensor protein